MRSSFFNVAAWLWAAVGMVWLTAAMRTKPVARAQPPASRILEAGIAFTGFLVLFHPRLRVGVLAERFIPASNWAGYAGLGLTAAGVLFAIWARFFLGGNWSATVTIKRDHNLVRSGPYGIVRHPIYCGLLCASMGTALIVGDAASLVGFALTALGWWLKSGSEERFLLERFGEDYALYRREVKRLIPLIL